MKKIKTGFVLMLLFATLITVGYASDSSPGTTKAISKNVEQKKLFASLNVPAFTLSASAETPILYAQLETPTTEIPLDLDTNVSVDNDVGDIVSALNIPVDTVNSIDEIVDKGTYYVKTIPKGGSVKDWIGWVFGVLGLLVGAFFFFRRKFTKKE